MMVSKTLHCFFLHMQLCRCRSHGLQQVRPETKNMSAHDIVCCMQRILWHWHCCTDWIVIHFHINFYFCKSLSGGTSQTFCCHTDSGLYYATSGHEATMGFSSTTLHVKAQLTLSTSCISVSGDTSWTFCPTECHTHSGQIHQGTLRHVGSWSHHGLCQRHLTFAGTTDWALNAFEYRCRQSIINPCKIRILSLMLLEKATLGWSM